jgi:hypothetical protein
MPNDCACQLTAYTVPTLSENKSKWQHHSCVPSMSEDDGRSFCLQEAELERYTTVPPLEQLLGEEDSSQAHIKVRSYPCLSSKVVLFFAIHVVPHFTLLNA